MPQQGESQPQTPGESEAEERVNFSARVRASVRKRARLYAAAHDVNLQDLMDAALDEFLAKRGA